MYDPSNPNDLLTLELYYRAIGDNNALKMIEHIKELESEIDDLYDMKDDNIDNFEEIIKYTRNKMDEIDEYLEGCSEDELSGEVYKAISEITSDVQIKCIDEGS